MGLAARAERAGPCSQYFPGQPYHATCPDVPAPVCRKPANGSNMEAEQELPR
jgi:hypothetical protein